MQSENREKSVSWFSLHDRSHPCISAVPFFKEWQWKLEEEGLTCLMSLLFITSTLLQVFYLFCTFLFKDHFPGGIVPTTITTIPFPVHVEYIRRNHAARSQEECLWNGQVWLSQREPGCLLVLTVRTKFDKSPLERIKGALCNGTHL